MKHCAFNRLRKLVQGGDRREAAAQQVLPGQRSEQSAVSSLQGQDAAALGLTASLALNVKLGQA